MSQNPNILQELIELESILATVKLQPDYEVPYGYFEELAGLVLNRIRALKAENVTDELSALSPTLNAISRQMPYSVPDGYFEGLDEMMMQHVRQNKSYLQSPKDELYSLSPLLAGLSKEMPYSVPQGYFDGIHTEVNKKPDAKPVAKVVSITTRKWFRYAAAAVVSGIIAMSVLLLTANQNTGKSMAKFEMKLNKEIKKMSDQELNDFIQYTDTERDLVQNEAREDVKKLLKDVPVTEMQEFLEEIADPEISADEKSSMD